MHRPREWRREERRLSKHTKGVTWHKGESQISAPLIIDPVAGPLVERLQVECKNFEDKFGMKIPVVMRAGRLVKQDAPFGKWAARGKNAFPARGLETQRRGVGTVKGIQ